ncbi:MAG: DNA-directed RNA polymerase subunit beta, partial [Clostridia bacterium]|nr:DNA-directed RNA polymerase subunit beta [Clostridia bacterium]
MPQRTHTVKYGNTERECFSKIHEPLEIPYLIELQKESYKQFITTGIQEVLDDFSPVCDRGGRFELHYLGFKLDDETKYSIKECKDRDTTYARALRVKVRLVRKETGEITEEEVFMGDLPMITDNGSFIINGAERVIVSQLVRSPGVYSVSSMDKSGIERFETTIMPNRGAWLEFKQDLNSILWVNVDRNRKIPATVLLRSLGISSDEELYDVFGKEDILIKTIEKDATKTIEDARIELYKRLRPGEIPSQEGISQLIESTFYDDKKYNFMRVGRYKVNKKLALATRIEGHTLAKDVVSADGEVLAEQGQVVDIETAQAIQNAGVNVVYLKKKIVKEGESEEFKVIGNNTVDMIEYLKSYYGDNIDFTAKDLGILEKVYTPALIKLMQENQDLEELKKAIKLPENRDKLVIKNLTLDDVVATVSYNLGLSVGFGEKDNIDHLANRRI